MLPPLIKNLKTHLFSPTQENWLQAVGSKNFCFNSARLEKWSVNHLTIPQLNNYITNDYPNYITYLTTKPVSGVSALSSAQSFKKNLMGDTNAETFVCLIEDCNITYSGGYEVPLALLPFIVSFINEGNLLNTTNYIEYSTTFIQPIRNYLLIDNLPLYIMYENFYTDLNNNLITLGYSPEETKLIHYEVSRVLNTLSFTHKGMVLSEDQSVELFSHAWKCNDKVRYLK